MHVSVKVVVVVKVKVNVKAVVMVKVMVKVMVRVMVKVMVKVVVVVKVKVKAVVAFKRHKRCFMKPQKIQLTKAPPNLHQSAYWRNGTLLINGEDARDIVRRALDNGTLKAGAEVFPRDSKPVWTAKKKGGDD